MKLYNDDCLKILPTIQDKSIDMILCDLPYGTTGLRWDEVIPIEELWKQYQRIIRPNRAIVLFAQQPFTSLLITSNIKWWKYNWIWEKPNGTNILSSHYQPLKLTEDICVFGTGATSYSPKGNMIYNPQFAEGKPYVCKSGKQKEKDGVLLSAIANHNSRNIGGYVTKNEGIRYPKNILKFNRDKEKLHPTQKPVALLEYLIKTYTNEGDTVLDNCMGVGSTGVACVNTNRDFIGIELDQHYFKIAKDRIGNG